MIDLVFRVRVILDKLLDLDFLFFMFYVLWFDGCCQESIALDRFVGDKSGTNPYKSDVKIA
jgi:hypothetical protein